MSLFEYLCKKLWIQHNAFTTHVFIIQEMTQIKASYWYPSTIFIQLTINIWIPHNHIESIKMRITIKFDHHSIFKQVKKSWVSPRCPGSLKPRPGKACEILFSTKGQFWSDYYQYQLLARLSMIYRLQLNHWSQQWTGDPERLIVGPCQG